MEHVVYILYSHKFAKSYIGETASIISRFHSHNSFSKKGWTLRYRPWVVAHIEFFGDRKQAMKREKWFKTGAGRRQRDRIIKEFLENHRASDPYSPIRRTGSAEIGGRGIPPFRRTSNSRYIINFRKVKNEILDFFFIAKTYYTFLE